MPELLTNPTHWHLRAKEARSRAQQLDDPETKNLQLKMAEKYDHLAACATEWLNRTEDIPRFLKSPPTAPWRVVLDVTAEEREHGLCVSVSMSETETATFSQYYRTRAKECREVGSSLRDPKVRAEMFKLAIDYDLKAKEAEADEHAESVRIGNSRGKLIGLAAALLKATPRLSN